MRSLIEDVNQAIQQSDIQECNITPEEVHKAIKALKSDKSDGSLGVFSNHVIHAPQLLNHWLAALFRSMLCHGHTPYDLLNATIVSIPKDTAQPITDSNNYRGIALCSSICKVFDLVILHRYSGLLMSSNLQFSYKSEHSTTMCTAVLRETIAYYNSRNTNVYSCLLDASKAFDRVNFLKLFETLRKRKLPHIIIRCLIDMYTRQSICATWNGFYSDTFTASNGTKQGAILSPCIFTCYLDGMLQELRSSGYGCRIGPCYVGSLGYADDVTLNSPSIEGLQKMLDICSNYGFEYDMLFNEKKTVCMAFGDNIDIKELPPLRLNDKLLEWVTNAKHLGNKLNMCNSDHDDVCLKKGSFIANTNKIICKFQNCNHYVKTNLFRAYCGAFYGSQMWNLRSQHTDNLWLLGIRQ